VLRAALFMPAMSAMRYNPVVAALAARLKIQGRLKGKQIVVAAMLKLLVLCFGVLKSGKPFDRAIGSFSFLPPHRIFSLASKHGIYRDIFRL
jgi:transposase